MLTPVSLPPTSRTGAPKTRLRPPHGPANRSPTAGERTATASRVADQHIAGPSLREYKRSEVEAEEPTRGPCQGRQPPVAVVGTGVIGTIYAALLREQGCAVTHLVRPGTATARDSLLEVDWLDLRRGRRRHRRQLYHYNVVEALPPDIAFVLVPVRLYQLADVLQSLTGMPSAFTTVIFTANWAGPGPLDQALPHGNYVLADAVAGGSRAGGKLTVAIKPVLPLGAVRSAAEGRAQSIREVFSGAGLAPAHESDILQWHWLQYALNAAMWPALVEAGSARAVVNDREVFRRMLLAVHEALNICAARGVVLERFPEARIFLDDGRGVSGRFRAWLTGHLYRFAGVHSEYHRRCMAHALSDRREIAVAYHSVRDTGREFGCRMPAFDSFRAVIDGSQPV